MIFCTFFCSPVLKVISCRSVLSLNLVIWFFPSAIFLTISSGSTDDTVLEGVLRVLDDDRLAVLVFFLRSGLRVRGLEQSDEVVQILNFLWLRYNPLPLLTSRI